MQDWAGWFQSNNHRYSGDGERRTVIKDDTGQKLASVYLKNKPGQGLMAEIGGCCQRPAQT
jgi:hypothetical protein